MQAEQGSIGDLQKYHNRYLRNRRHTLANVRYADPFELLVNRSENKASNGPGLLKRDLHNSGLDIEQWFNLN
ncbi:hypothetical protein GWI33_014272 [Rhynchophorus ferrugineus]|uniref:Uncharacterized protein n=1 Tax=Rhynchophorus ferrugineus TaxID=354439 RepID=A0A834MAU0_RHYFE|nr:hypothetical protein GWI33_014272 [Rhynchophorus ferrugineus]